MGNNSTDGYLSDMNINLLLPDVFNKNAKPNRLVLDDKAKE
jgi:hypothetical protein